MTTYVAECPIAVYVTPDLYTPEMPILVTVFAETGQIECPISVYVTRPGVLIYSAECPIRVEVTGASGYIGYTPECPIEVEVFNPGARYLEYVAHCPIGVAVTAEYTPECPLAVAVFDGTFHQLSSLDTTSPDFWEVAVTLNGEDVTYALTGAVTIHCVEDSATIAEFSLLPRAGTVDPTDYVNAPVTISFEGSRRFTGYVDTPDYDPDTTLLHMTCTDGLQTRFEAVGGAAIRAVADATTKVIQAENARNKVVHTIAVTPTLTQRQIDTRMLAAEESVALAKANLVKAGRLTGPTVRGMVGGLWSPFIFTSNDGWDAFKDCMSTQLASYNLDSNGNGVNTSWLAKETPDFTFTEADFEDQSLRVGKIANARSIINSVDIKFEYRFTRLFEYQFNLTWAPGDDYAKCAAFGYQNFGINDHKRIADAITGAGLCVRSQRGYNGHTLPAGTNTGLYMYPVPAPGWATLPNGVNVGYLSDSPRFSGVGSFTANVLKRYKQTVSETVIHSMTFPRSIARTGRLNKVVEHAVESSIQTNAVTARLIENWEDVTSDEFTYPVSRYGVSVNGNVPAGEFSATALVDVPLKLNRYTYAVPETQAPGTAIRPTVPSASLQYWDMTQGLLDGRAERNNAFATAKAFATRSIVESHRQNEVSFTLPAHTSLELSHTVRVRRETPLFDAKGKVKALVHTYDMTSGRHSTEVTLALIKSWSSGVHYVDPYVPLPDTSTIVYKGTTFRPNLTTWPQNPLQLLTAGEAERPADSQRFRGYNFFTGEMVIEAPPTPQEAQQAFSSITRTSETLSLPDDLFQVGA